MKLDDKQERLVARYYQEIASRMNGLSVVERERVLGLLRVRVADEMQRYGEVQAGDDEVLALLRLCTRAIPELAPVLNRRQEQLDLDLASPIYSTPTYRHEPGARERDDSAKGAAVRYDRLLESTEHRRWLGVCWHLSRRLGVEVRYVRLGAVVLGVLAGPFALIAYVGMYFEMYFSSERRMQPAMDPVRLVKTLLQALLASFGMFLASHFILIGIRAAYQKLFGEEIPAMGGLNWLEVNGVGLFLLVLIATLPFAALSALPMADGWDETAGKVYKAVLALYAVAISLGIAAFLVGVMLGFVQRYTG